MSSRMDLEARLRALREGKRAPHTAPSTPIDQPHPAPIEPTPVAPQASASHQGQVMDTRVVLGPEYDNAIAVARFAIDNERQRHVHTAIDAYIRAGQMLIATGRNDPDAQLQTAVRKKALALLQRAEALSEWAERVKCENRRSRVPQSDMDALNTAYEAEQRRDDAKMDSQQQLVTQMKKDNRGMQDQLNKLVLFAKLRGRLSRAVSNRRARKQEEAEATGNATTHQQHTEPDAPPSPTSSPSSSSSPMHSEDATTELPLEKKRQLLINDLHKFLNLPEISHFRTFKPLSIDEQRERRQQQLAAELEEAKQEADRLRAAVTELTASLQDAGPHSEGAGRVSEVDFQQLKDELERVKEELEAERRLSSCRMSRETLHDDEFDNTDMMRSLHASLQAIAKQQKSGADTHAYDGLQDNHQRDRLSSHAMDEYAKIKLLGKGAFGHAFLMREKRKGGKLVCIKEITSPHSHGHHGGHGHCRAAGTPTTEIQMMKTLRHPNLIRLLRSFQADDCWYIVMEYCSGGDLRQFLRGGQALSEDKILYMFLQLCLGLHHMHTHHVLHRDIKTSNIFLSNAGFLVLGDLGIARDLGHREMAMTVIGTPLYMSPEMLEDKAYSYASDVWALGCVLYELCTGNPPFQANNTPALFNKICRAEFAPLPSPRFSPRLQALVSQMLVVSPGKRPTVDAVLRETQIQIHLKRYYFDRFLSKSAPPSAEDCAIVQAQFAALGVQNMAQLTKDHDGSSKNEKSDKPDTTKRDSAADREVRLVIEREQQRKEQLMIALEHLRQMRQHQQPEDPEPAVALPVLQLGHVTKSTPRSVPKHRTSTDQEVQWKDPVRKARPLSSRHASPVRRSSASDVVFSGIPRRGVPLTQQAKALAASSPVCKDVRVLRKQETAKAAERYKARLEELNRPAKRHSVATATVQPFVLEVATVAPEEQDAIDCCIAELEEVLQRLQA
ncbi:TPA: hypothetical protein N0F65_000160 [Lagenidium giganteum]|uniref:non-specific serine/threonine protein kinase n=1 Tax=Lagenidium giganteum TaxID=4803 RepID=A0AAV2YTB2_9STRA|nr:TPA: hypothetical protein N0F65_000160 [Lagenidium giganteum]